MKNIHLFETKDSYDEAKNGLILPRVSYIKEKQDVKYNHTFDANGHDFVEIAGIKWATMNVGASDVTDTGLYFQWGGIQGYTAEQVGKKEDGKKPFAKNGSDYNSKLLTTYDKDGMILKPDDDAVHAYMGGSWRMPTSGDIDTLLNSTAVIGDWTDDYQGSKVAGYEFHDNVSNDTLFLPACGFASDGSMSGVDGFGRYWSSSLYSSSDVSKACGLDFDNGVGGEYWHSYVYRFYGFSVRGVLDEK